MPTAELRPAMARDDNWLIGLAVNEVLERGLSARYHHQGCCLIGPWESCLSEIDKKRRLGAFYTPQPLARSLVTWALAGTPGTLLDPSFGGCSFLDAAVGELTDLGVSAPLLMVVGIDVDPDARAQAAHLIRSGMPRGNIQIRDFFSVDPPNEGDLFDCVVGNPPYVRHHWIPPSVKARATAVAGRSCPELNGRASLWTYFTVHARNFLRPGGRLAFLLPGSALEADYAEPLRRWLEREFASTTLLEFADRVFDADESTVVLLADGAGNGPGRVYLSRLQDMSQLDQAVGSAADVPSHSFTTDDETPASALVDELASLSSFCQLRDLACVRLGVVTGANSFFVRTSAEVDSLLDSGVSTVPILSRSARLSAASWRSSDQQAVREARQPSSLLVIDRNVTPSPALAAEIAQAEADSIHLRTKCAARTPWFSLRDIRIPDAFLPYMGASPPRLVLNRSGATVTNAIHRLWWKSRTSRLAAAVASWTTVWALTCERYGRSYGGGVLKIEPGRAQSMHLPIVPAAGAYFSEVDSLARAGRQAEARELADDVVLRRGIGLTRRDLSHLREEAQRLASRRNRAPAS